MNQDICGVIISFLGSSDHLIWGIQVSGNDAILSPYPPLVYETVVIKDIA